MAAGVSNGFLVASRSTTALLYNDNSVNENMHLALAFRILLKPENNFLEGCASRALAKPDR
jgi:3'5'-cyclic nucleotide phosphodiesterase